MEYDVTWQDHCLIPGGGAAYHMANRAQNLRAYFYPEGLKAVRRTETEPSWVWQCRLVAFGREDNLRTVNSVKPSASGDCVEYARGPIVERFENREDGIRQIIVVERAPTGPGPLQFVIRIDGDLDGALEPSGAGILFTRHRTRKLRYGAVRAVDAKGVSLPVSIRIDGADLNVEVVDAGGVGPITLGLSIDDAEPEAGVLSSPDWTVESNSAAAEYGWSVATAGDVNGDGCSEIIIGAPHFDAGAVHSGRAFLYYGSPAGVAGGAGWTTDGETADAELGYAVATAGDVNNDGFSDVLIGAPATTGTHTLPGTVYLYLGSADGLSTEPAWTADGSHPNAAFGCSVATAGDVNGDAFSDILVGACAYSDTATSQGAAYLWHGGSGGPSATPDWTIVGGQDGAQLGRCVATAGDVNGDGFSDVVVGVPFYDTPTADGGRIHTFHGSATGLSQTSNGTREMITSPDARFGWSVSTAGDVNGDGYADVIVGAPRYHHFDPETFDGQVFVFHGSAAGLESAAAWRTIPHFNNHQLGYSVAAAGDVNGDGYCDIIVGGPFWIAPGENEGNAQLFLGSAEGLIMDEGLGRWIDRGEYSLSRFGWAVATAGDVNGDGFSDILVGSPGYSNSQDDEGAAYVYHGSGDPPQEGAQWNAEGDQMGAQYGLSVASAGDVNGDGFADVIVGAPFYDAGMLNEGQAFVYHGTAEGLNPIANWTADGGQAGAQFGHSVAGAGDVNGDGYGDVIVGALMYDNGPTTNTGRVFVFHGSARGLSGYRNWDYEVSQQGAQFGNAVASAGDVNGDGYADVLVGAWLHDSSEANGGAFWVFRGSTDGLSASNYSMSAMAHAGALLGTSVASAGDVNGDGYSDVIVGAPGYSGGRVFVYHGSRGGLRFPATWIAQSDQGAAGFGTSVASAGDINGDGFSDVIVGAPLYDIDTRADAGAAFVWHGSADGLGPVDGTPANADGSVEGARAGDGLGWSVACAGDATGDGLADVIVGAPLGDEIRTDEGLAYVYEGTPAGLGSSRIWRGRELQADSAYGVSVASAGDVNGDGFADIIVGANLFETDRNNEGAAFLYYGNYGRGAACRPRQLQPGGLRAISPLGMSDEPDQFRMSMLGRTPFGRGMVCLEYEVKPLGVVLDGSSTVRTFSWVDTTRTGQPFEILVKDLPDGTTHHWRARLLYHPAAVPFQRHGPWLTPPWNGWNETDFRTPIKTGVSNWSMYQVNRSR